MQLSILIPTISERLTQFTDLLFFLRNIIDLHDLNSQVEILYDGAGPEKSIGQKRQDLYWLAAGIYAWQIDDDDYIASDAIPLIMEAITLQPDCITFEERCYIDGLEKRSNFSLRYDDWHDAYDGYDYVRTPFFKTPIKTDICQSVVIPRINFGEDHAFARAIKPLLQTEVHIDKQLYYYTKNNF